MKKTFTQNYTKTTDCLNRRSSFSSLAKHYLSLTALLILGIGLSTSNLQAQAYLECTNTIQNEDGFNTYLIDAAVTTENGNSYLAYGLDATDSPKFPVVNGSGLVGSMDEPIYIAAFDENCNQTLGTYFGGSGTDEPTDIAIDPSGNIIVTGTTSSLDYPTTDGTSAAVDDFDQTSTFVTSFAPDGTIVFSTLISAVGYELGREVEISNNTIFVAGITNSPGLSTTDGSSTNGLNYDAFLYSYDLSGNLLASTISQANSSNFNQIVQLQAVDNGVVLSHSGLTIGEVATDGSITDGDSHWVVNYDSNLNTVWSTAQDEDSFDIDNQPIASDASGIYLITKYTNSTSTFLNKYDYSGNLIYSTSLNTTDAEALHIFAANGDVYISVKYNSGTYPTAAATNTPFGSTDVLIIKVDGTTGVIDYATFVGNAGINGGNNSSGSTSPLSVDAEGNVYFIMSGDSYTSPTDNSMGQTTLVKLDAEGNLCLARSIQISLESEFSSFNVVNAIEVDGDNVRAILYDDDNPLTRRNDAWTVLNFRLCPDITINELDIITDDQSVCANGIIEQLIGVDFTVDGSTFPQINPTSTGFVDQQDIELYYQWQSAPIAAGPWTDIPGVLAQQKNYSPPPSVQNVYYRRLTLQNPCCGSGDILSTSNTVEILVDAGTAPVVDAGGIFYTCPGAGVVIGGDPTATGAGGFTYDWGGALTNVANPTAAPTENTIYTLFVTDQDGCVQADQATVITYSADAGGDSFVCDDGLGNITPTTIGGSPLAGVPVVPLGGNVIGEYGVAYTWTSVGTGATTLSCTDCPNPSANEVDTYTLTVTIYQPDGSSCTTSDDVIVDTAISPPTGEFAGPDIVVCKDETGMIGTPAPPVVSTVVDAGTMLSNVSQSSGTTLASTTNLTDGDFNTGGLTSDGTGQEIVIDLGSIVSFNHVDVARINNSDYRYDFQVSTDDINYTTVHTFARSSFFGTVLSNSAFTTVDFPLVSARYIRLVSINNSRDVNISELRAYTAYRFQWSPGEFITTDGSMATFDAGGTQPENNPYTYTLTATLGECNFYDQVQVYVISADATEDGCGPRFIGVEDNTPLLDETYQWNIISQTGTSNFISVDDEARVTVTGNATGETTYQLTTTFVLDGVTYTCTDEVVVPPCGCNVIVAETNGNCPDFDSGYTTLFAEVDNALFVPEDFTYAWTLVDGSPAVGLDTDTGQEVTLVDNVERTYRVTATNIIDPSFSCTGDIPVNLPAFSTPTFSANSPYTTCTNNTINIGDPAEVPDYTYTWEPTTGLDFTNSNSFPEVTISESATYLVTITDDITGCYTTEIIQVNIEQLGTAGPDIGLCSNGTVTLEAEVYDPSYTYVWSPTSASSPGLYQNGTDENSLQPEIFVSSDIVMTFTITDPATSCQTVDMVNINVTPLPNPFTLTDLSVCPSDVNILGWTNADGTGTNEVPGPSADYTYLWSPGDLLDDDEAQNPTITGNLTGPTTFTLTLVGDGGCNQIATQTITPNVPIPVVNGGSICVGETLNIGSGENTTNGGTYSWLPSTDIDDDSSPNPLFTAPSVPGSYTYTVTRTDGGCTTQDEVTIIVDDITAPTDGFDPVLLCQGQTVVIGPAPEVGISYEWSPTTGLSDPYIAQPTFIGTESETYTLTVVNASGCTDQATVSVTVSDTPPPTVSLNDFRLCTFVPSNIIDATVTGGSGDYAYFWSPSAFLSSANVEDPILINPGEGIYTFSLTVIDQVSGCSATEDVTITIEICSAVEGQIGDQLFVDEDGDGLYNPFVDTPITDVTVILTPEPTVDLGNGPGVPINTTTDPVTGEYLFTELPAGDYTVTVDITDPDFPEDVVNTVDPDGGLPNTSDVTLGAGEVNLMQDFGYEPETGTIGNYVWLDENSDGLQDAGEPGIANVLVILKDENGDPIDSTYTDASGGYLFDELPEGTYFVDVDETTLAESLSQTDPTLEDGIIPVGSDFGNQDHSGDGYEIMLGAGEENLTADFGYNHNPDTDVNGDMGLAAIGNQVWIDSDGEGDQDPNEVSVEGAIITLYGDPDGNGVFTVIAMDTTDANGNYLFDDLVPGAYYTEVTGTTDDASHDILSTANYTQTGDPDEFGEPSTAPDNQQTDPVVLGPGDVFLNADYGYQPTPANDEVGSIGNTIWLDADADGNGPAGVNGDVANGNGLNDSSEEPITGVSVSLIQDTNENGVWDEGEPIIATDVTDENGQYLFDGLPIDDGGGDGDADYIVWVNDSDNVLEGLENTYDVDGGAGMDADGLGDDADMVGGLSAAMISSASPDATNQDFGYTPAGNEAGDGYIGNYVWFDVDGNDPNGQSDADADMDSGIEGVVMELLDDMGNVIATTETDENGFYYFGGLPVDADGEQYQVRVASENFDEGGVLAGFTNSYDPDNMVTSPDDEGALVSLTTANPGNLDQDFGYTNAGGTDGMIGNQIWEDTDADGVYEPGDGEMGIEGVTIDLYADLNDNGVVDPGEPVIGTTTTDANGQYQFTGLPVDDEDGEDVSYVVDVTDEDGILNGYWHSEGTPNTDNNSQTDPYAVTLSDSAPSDQTADFGYYKEPAALGNYVWEDTNMNGLQDDGESGLNDVVVQLEIEYPDGTTVTLYDTTRNDAMGNPGFYEFPNLLNDEDYNMGTSGTPSADGLPQFTISVDENQSVFTDAGLMPTTTDVNGNGNDLEDSDDFAGVVAIPMQGNQNTNAIDPETGENVVASYDFGVTGMELGAIGNYVWVDENSDGLQDAGEPGIPNIKVILNDENGNPIDSTYTDASGGYLFDDLPEGTYYVDIDEMTLPDGMTQTPPSTNAGADFGNQDHSGDGYQIDLGAGEENLTADFGYNHNPDTDVNGGMGLAAIGDRVWIDSDGEGDQDPNEVGVSGVEITLFGDPDGDGVFQEIGKDTTDSNGNYLFDGLTPGAYYTEVTDDADASHDILDTNDYTQTGDPDDFGEPASDPDNQQTDPVVLGPGDVFLNADYGYQPEASAPLGSIGNTVWLDADADGNGPAGVNGDTANGNGAENDSSEEPIAGVSVSLIQDTNENGVWDEGEPIIASDVTDENGQYLFDGLPLDDGGSDGDADYLVWVNDADNVLDGLENTYDADGGAGTDTDGLGDDADMVGGLSAAMISSASPDATNQDFGYTPEGNESGDGYIGNYVWFDVDGNDPNGQSDADADMDSGIESVVMELLDDNGEVIATTETDENGFYLFGGLTVDADGEDYQVRVASSNFDEGGVLAGLANSYDPDDMTTSPDDEGALVTLTTAMPGNLDQDFGYTNAGGTDGMIGNQIWEDTDADGVYEPGDGEMGIEGVTIDLYADLNDNGVVDPGEPVIGTTTTDANGQYQFTGLPVDDEDGEDVSYVVDVTDEDGILNGYWHSEGTPNTDNNSQTDTYAVTLSDTEPSDQTADFGYYKNPASLGNYVFVDTNVNGVQDAGDTPLAGVVVTLDITYPDGTMVTVYDTTDANGFYEFPNLLNDEDYAVGAGSNGADPTATSPSAGMPKYVISVDENQMVLTDNNYSPTITDQTLVGGNDLNDSDDFDGVVGTPVQGNQNTTANADPTMEDPVASMDFGVAAELDLATILQVTSTTPAQGFYDDNDPITFTSTTTNQGGVPISDLTITNYLPSELENSALVASSLMINGMAPPVGVTIMMVGNNYVIDFGNDPNNWLQPDDIVTFEMTADITNGTAPGASIVNTTEISSYDTDNSAATTPPADVDSTPDSTNGNGSTGTGNDQGETDGENLVDDETGEDGTSGGDEDDHDIAPVPNDAVLPVELLGFEAKADKDHIDLAWSTASEFNNSHFELERSEDGKVFKQIARIEGQGTTLGQTDYSYEDQEAIPNVLYYYRLKQVDTDGQFEYSEVRTAQLEATVGEMELYPNPIGDATELQVRFYTTELTKEFVIVDIHNRSVLQVKQDLKNTGWNTMSIDIQVLPAGTYILLDQQGNSKRFVKTRE